MELLSLLNDVVFKAFFAQEGNENLLIHFLQAVLELSDDELSEVTILNPDLPKLTVDDRGFIVDLYVKSKTGEIYHIEIQTFSLMNFSKKGLHPIIQDLLAPN